MVTRQQLERMTCTLNGVQVQRVRGALAEAVRLLEGLYFHALTSEHKGAALFTLETVDYIRKALAELQALTRDIPEADFEGIFNEE